MHISPVNIIKDLFQLALVIFLVVFVVSLFHVGTIKMAKSFECPDDCSCDIIDTFPV